MRKWLLRELTCSPRRPDRSPEARSPLAKRSRSSPAPSAYKRDAGAPTTRARELVDRFTQWQQQHAWRQLEGVGRLWATSDLHVEHDENMSFLRSLDGFSGDGLIVAGDICTSIDRLRATLTLLVGKFKHVFFVAGNHEVRGAVHAHDCRT